MKILFITLEQSGRQILKSILDDNFFKTNKNQIFTFGMDDGYKEFNDLTNTKITPIMGFVDIILNLKYLFNLRLKIKEIVDLHSFTHIFFVDSFDFSKFYIQKYKFRVICLFNNNILISEKDNFLKKIRANKISLIIL